MALGKFSLAGESHKFSLEPSKTPFSQTLHFMGNWPFQGKGKAICKGKLSLGGKIFPLRENSPNLPSEGKFCLKRCYGVIFPVFSFFFFFSVFFQYFSWKFRVAPSRVSVVSVAGRGEPSKWSRLLWDQDLREPQGASKEVKMQGMSVDSLRERILERLPSWIGMDLLADAPEELTADWDFMTEAVSKNGLALQFASEELRSDRDIVTTAVSISGRALEHASEELRCDRNIVMTAVSTSWQALQYAPEDLRSDSEILASTNFGSPPKALVLKATLLSGRSCTLVVREGETLSWTVQACARNLGLEGTTAGVLITSDGTELSSHKELQVGTLNEVTFVIP